MLSSVNVVGSAIAKASDDVIYTWAGPGNRRCDQLRPTVHNLLLYTLSPHIWLIKLGKISKEEYADFIKEIESLPDKVAEILKSKEDVQYLAQSSIIAIQYSLSAETLTMQYLLKAH